MRWYEASSPEDLKTLGKLKTVKSMINKDIREIIGKQKIDSFIKMGSNSWKGVKKNRISSCRKQWPIYRM